MAEEPLGAGWLVTYGDLGEGGGGFRVSFGLGKVIEWPSLGYGDASAIGRSRTAWWRRRTAGSPPKTMQHGVRAACPVYGAAGVGDDASYRPVMGSRGARVR
jgi:hypothetical protein